MRRYRIDDERGPIRELQRYLLTLAYLHEEIPKVTIDGFYSETTREAVKVFQQMENIEESGVVDLETWELLYTRYREATVAEESSSAFPHTSDFPLHLGETGIAVIVLQALLTELSYAYPNVLRPAVTGQFGLTTADSVRALQRNYGRYADGVVDLALWARMIRDYEARRTQERSGGHTP